MISHLDCQLQIISYTTIHLHYVTDFIVSKPHLEVNNIKYCKYKAIYLDAFNDDLSESELCNKGFSALDELASCCQNILSRLIDKHAMRNQKEFFAGQGNLGTMTVLIT